MRLKRYPVPAMGSPCEVRFYGDDEAALDATAEAAREEIPMPAGSRRKEDGLIHPLVLEPWELSQGDLALPVAPPVRFRRLDRRDLRRVGSRPERVRLPDVGDVPGGTPQRREFCVLRRQRSPHPVGDRLDRAG